VDARWIGLNLRDGAYGGSPIRRMQKKSMGETLPIITSSMVADLNRILSPVKRGEIKHE
jgi:hypothetical protein